MTNPTHARRQAQQDAVRRWLHVAASCYDDGIIPAAAGGTWMTAISQRTGYEQSAVERLARDIGVWTATAQDVRQTRLVPVESFESPVKTGPGDT